MMKLIILVSVMSILTLAGSYLFLKIYNPDFKDILIKDDCLKRNGMWVKQGLSGEKNCNLPASDAGKICTSSDQCQGRCIGESVAVTSGKCSDYQKVFGCHPFVENGLVPGILCVD